VAPFISLGIDERVRDAVNDTLPLEMMSVLVRTAIDERVSSGATVAAAGTAAPGEGQGGHGVEGGDEVFDAVVTLERWANMTSRLALESMHTAAQRAASHLQTAVHQASAAVALHAVSPPVTSERVIHSTSLTI
jgi:hypothetical protein